MAIWPVHADESYDDKNERVFAIGSVMGSDEQLDLLRTKWLDRTEGRPFHATDCETDQGFFAEQPHEENQKLYKDLTLLLAGSSLNGFATAINLQDYRKTFPKDLPPAPYFWCFITILKYYRETALKLVNSPNVVKFTFERKFDIEYNAAKLYSYFCNRPEWQSYVGDAVSFESRDKCVPLQFADLLAREHMKCIDNFVGPVYRFTRKSMAALYTSRKFEFDYYDSSSFAKMWDRAMKLGQPDMNAYYRWLEEQGRQDNMTNRIEFLARIDPVGRYGANYTRPQAL